MGGRLLGGGSIGTARVEVVVNPCRSRGTHCEDARDNVLW
jgi:hypothetical protein